MFKRKLLLFVLFFIVNTVASQSIKDVIFDTVTTDSALIFEDTDSITDNTILTDSEIAFQDSIDILNKENTMLSDSRKEYNYALVLFNDGKFKEAIPIFTNAIMIDSSFSEAYFYRGKCYESFNTTLSILDYQIAFNLDSSNLDPLYSIAKMQSASDINSAIDTYHLIISYNNQQSKANYEIGVLFYLRNDIQEAIKFFTYSIEIKKDARTFNDRASCYRILGDNDLAIADYIAAIELDPELSFIYNNLASAYRKEGDSKKALSYYSLAISKDASYALAYNNRGSLYIDIDNIEAALSDIEKAISINKDYSLAYNNKGVIFHIKEQYDDALIFFDKAIALDSEYGKAYLNRGITRQIIRDEEGACNDWIKARELGINIANKYLANDCN